jgi:simple sugar transport system ATP-binding protein
MVGKDVAALEQQEAEVESRHARATGGQPLVEVKRMGRRGSVYPVSFTINKGQAVGLAGLLGSGRTEINRLLFGVDEADEGGTLVVDGVEVRPRSPRQAVMLGFAMTPEDRKAAGIIPNLSVRENIILALQSKRGIWRRVSPVKQRELADRYIDSLKIKTPGREHLVKNLSGGNQQKVLLARWLAVQPRLLILDEPTRGIDVGAKAEIEKLVVDLAAHGMSVVFVSSEIEEVARTSQRVVVMRDRKQVGQLEGQAVSVHAILDMIAKNSPETEAA